jgi:hypothetical protein
MRGLSNDDKRALAMANRALERQVQEGEADIAKAMKRNAPTYKKVLESISGKQWTVRTSSDLMALTSKDRRHAVDLYWGDYDPVMHTATIVVEAGNAIRAFPNQRRSKMRAESSAKSYLGWLKKKFEKR